MPSNRLLLNGALDAKTWVSGLRSQRAKRQYVALLECVGAPKIARQLMEDVIVWATAARPPEHLVATWELEWHEGSYTVTEEDTRKMRLRLMAYEEWGNRAAIKALREALAVTAGKVRDGTLDLEAKEAVVIKYLADGLSMNTTATATAFGSPKPTTAQINKLVINAGPPPPKRIRKAPPAAPVIREPVIEGEFTAIDSPGGST